MVGVNVWMNSCSSTVHGLYIFRCLSPPHLKHLSTRSIYDRVMLQEDESAGVCFKSCRLEQLTVTVFPLKPVF